MADTICPRVQDLRKHTRRAGIKQLGTTGRGVHFPWNHGETQEEAFKHDDTPRPRNSLSNTSVEFQSGPGQQGSSL